MKTLDAQHLTVWLADPAGSAKPDRAESDAILAAYPWFTTVRLLRAGAARAGDPLSALSSLTRPLPGRLLEYPSAADFEKRTETELIDAFLRKGEYRIIPQDNTPDADLIGERPDENDDVPVSEELADIYLAQGLTDKAKAIYSKLCLLYPEKNVYFAEIIERITTQTE